MNHRSATGPALAALAVLAAGCGGAARTAPEGDRCPIELTRASADGALPDDLDELERQWAVRLYDQGGRCFRVTFTAPVRSAVGACGGRAHLRRCEDERAAPLANYALSAVGCATRRGCDDMVPSVLEGTYAQEPAACQGLDLAHVERDDSRVTVGTAGASIVLRAPDRPAGSLPFDTLVLRVGGAQPGTVEVGRACKSETSVLAL